MSDKAVKALLDYEQADEDGVMVLASRQAIHEVVDALRKSEARVAELTAALEGASNAFRMSARFGLGDETCWCDGGKYGHSPGCKAVRIAVQNVREALSGDGSKVATDD